MHADRFGAQLAAELAGEPDNRFQGMPSDGDSRAGYEAMGREGWIGLHWPEQLGGRGLDPLATVAAEERFGYHWLPLSGYLLSVKTIGNVLLGHASDGAEGAPAARDRRRPAACSARASPSRRPGSDLAALRTSARREGERFVVSGHKIWTSSAQIADWIYLAVRTDPDASRPHRGVSVLVADMRSPGIEVREIDTVGGGVLCEVFLTDVEVPASQLVGELHGGWRVLMSTLDHERVTSEKVGVVLRVLDDLEAEVRLRERAARTAQAARRGRGRPPAGPARRCAARATGGRRRPLRRWRSCRSRRWCGGPRRWVCACSARARSWSTGPERLAKVGWRH